MELAAAAALLVCPAALARARFDVQVLAHVPPPGQPGLSLIGPDRFIYALGTVDQIVEQIQAAREQYGFSYIQVDGRDVDAFAPIMGRLIGK